MTAIRLKKAWKIWRVGHVIPEMPPNQASLLIERGIAEPYAAPEKPAKSARGGMRAGRDYATRGA